MTKERCFVFVAAFILMFSMIFIQSDFAFAQNATTIPSVSSTSKGIDVSPIEGNRLTNGFNKMKNDITSAGQGIALPGFFGGLAVSAVLMLFGIVSKKCLKAGGMGLLISFIFLFLMGDAGTIGDWGENIASTIRSYWN
ncbi:hypothetical protein ABEV55_14805 [Aneurinibacillus thermoaerophilus]|uniref:hypothetical protein n=1 Tax=Aneurinibacillus thermoaerophilus TaxID=143495 RepID=UPI002E1E81D7|nr:hypothetical protein [Aneurinibacillus thermoaerophilus]